MDWSMSTRSPKEYANAGPLDIEATADLRKSMVVEGGALAVGLRT
jgi:hypothetical protein